MPEPRPLLILFEPFGTLVLGSQAVALASLQEALEDVYRISIDGEPLENFRGGGTTWQAAWSLLHWAGVPDEQIDYRRQAACDYAARLYRLRAGEDRAWERVHDGAREFLALARERGHTPGVVSLLPRALTGAVLAAAGFDDLLLGACADDVRYHTGLYPMARMEAGQRRAWLSELTVAVGSTPSVVCRARSDNVTAVGFQDPLETRRYISADVLISSFGELEDLIERRKPRPLVCPY